MPTVAAVWPRVFVAVLLMLPLLLVAQLGSEKRETETLVGDWRGDSVCLVKPSACHDEDSLYHVAPLADRPHWFSMKLDKIVDGKPVTMGTVECSHDPEKHTLACEFERGAFQFTVRGNLMQGTMKLKDGTVWRKLSLKKVTWDSSGGTPLQTGFIVERKAPPRHLRYTRLHGFAFIVGSECSGGVAGVVLAHSAGALAPE